MAVGSVMMKRYGVILADPPWDYDISHRRGAAGRHYPTMTADDIAALPVDELAADDAVLLLWATWPKLYEGVQQIIESWGFRYVTGLPWIKVAEVARSLFDGQVWIKPQWGTGYWVRGASEIVLLCKRGHPQMPEQPPIGLLCDRMIHSQKPADMHDYGQMLNGPYLELFARRARPGWDVWGNEVTSTVELTP